MSWGCPSFLHHLSSHPQEAEEPDISRTLRCININKSNDYKTFSSLALIRRTPGTGREKILSISQQVGAQMKNDMTFPVNKVHLSLKFCLEEKDDITEI